MADPEMDDLCRFATRPLAFIARYSRLEVEKFIVCQSGLGFPELREQLEIILFSNLFGSI